MLGSISFNQSHQSSLSHNNRENIYGNPGIDPARLHENIYFVQKDIRSVYKDVFQEAVTSITRNKNEMIVKLMTTITKYIKMIRHMSNENSL